MPSSAAARAHGDNAFADLLTARVAQFSQTSKQPKYYNRYTIVEPYVQDNWHATPNLTLNIGLRYEFFNAFHEQYGRDLPYDPATCPNGNCLQGSAFEFPLKRASKGNVVKAVTVDLGYASCVLQNFKYTAASFDRRSNGQSVVFFQQETAAV